VNGKREAPAVGREVVIVGLRTEAADLGRVFLGLGGDLELDRVDFRVAGSSFQTPKSCSNTMVFPSVPIDGQRTSRS